MRKSNIQQGSEITGIDCCQNLAPDFSGEPEAAGDKKIIGRRIALKRLAGLAGGIMFVSKRNAHAQGRQVLLAFCGQLLCVVPYEITRARGHFAEEGLDVRLVYTRGGNVAMQALVGNAVDYAGTSFDVALQAYGRGAKIVRFASTGRLPLFALAAAPKAAKEIRSLKDLENRTVGISALGNAEHVLARLSHEEGRRRSRSSALRDPRNQPLRTATAWTGRCGHGARAGVDSNHRRPAAQ